MAKIVLITGATSGFGKAYAEKFAANNYNLIITGRRGDRLKELEKDLRNKFHIDILSLQFDVRDKEKTFEILQSLPSSWQAIDVLINNAGLALGRDFFDEGDVEDWDTMIDTNVKGLLYISKAILPFMIKRKQGHIINMGSVAGKEVYEKGNAYCASKYAVDAITKSMRIDLLRHKIKVTSIDPGAAETEFGIVRFKGNEQIAKKVYDGFQPLSANDVADIVYYTTTLPPHVCINDLVLTCIAQADSIYFYRET